MSHQKIRVTTNNRPKSTDIAKGRPTKINLSTRKTVSDKLLVSTKKPSTAFKLNNKNNKNDNNNNNQDDEFEITSVMTPTCVHEYNSNNDIFETISNKQDSVSINNKGIIINNKEIIRKFVIQLQKIIGTTSLFIVHITESTNKVGSMHKKLINLYDFNECYNISDIVSFIITLKSYKTYVVNMTDYKSEIGYLNKMNCNQNDMLNIILSFL